MKHDEWAFSYSHCINPYSHIPQKKKFQNVATQGTSRVTTKYKIIMTIIQFKVCTFKMYFFLCLQTDPTMCPCEHLCQDRLGRRLNHTIPWIYKMNTRKFLVPNSVKKPGQTTALSRTKPFPRHIYYLISVSHSLISSQSDLTSRLQFPSPFLLQSEMKNSIWMTWMTLKG